MDCEYKIELINARTYITDSMIIYKDHLNHHIIACNVLYNRKIRKKTDTKRPDGVCVDE